MNDNACALIEGFSLCHVWIVLKEIVILRLGFRDNVDFVSDGCGSWGLVSRDHDYLYTGISALKH